MSEDNFSYGMELQNMEGKRNEEIALLEQHQLRGEPRYIEDEARNARFITIFGGIAALACLVGLILAWIIYHRDRTTFSLWHAIMFTVGFLVSLAIIAWASSAQKELLHGHFPSSGLINIAYLGALICAVFFVGATIWLMMHKPVHLCKLKTWRDEQGEWNRHLPDAWSLKKAWFRDNRILNWLVGLAAAAAFSFVFCAYAIWSIAFNRYRYSSIGMFLASLGMIVFGFMVIYWCEEAEEWEKFYMNGTGAYTTYITTLRVVAIIGIIIAAIGAMMRFIKNRVGYFIAGITSLVLFVLAICTAAMILKIVWESQTDPAFKESNCASFMAPIHKDAMVNWCPTKYLPEGQVCRKQDFTVMWESVDTPKPKRFLNPSCCSCMRQFFLAPFMYLGIFGLLFAFCCFINAVCLFYLADDAASSSGITRDGLSLERSVSGLGSMLFVLGLVAILLFGLYFTFRQPNRFYGSEQFKSFMNKDEIDPHFERVEDSILKQAATAEPDNNGNLKWGTKLNPAPKFDESSSTCKDQVDCVIRYALLAKNARIEKGDLGGAQVGSSQSRLNFFPDCTKVGNDYLLLYGTEAAIGTALQNLEFDIRDVKAGALDPEVIIYKDQVEKDKLNNAGLLDNETASNDLISKDGQNCGANLDKYKVDSAKHTSVKGRLFYRVNGTGDDKFDVHEDIQVSAYYNEDKITGGKLYENGIFIIPEVPINPTSDYKVTVFIEDPKNVFMEQTTDVVVPLNAGTETSAGRIQLATKDGNVCQATDTKCIEDTKLAQGDVLIDIVHAVTGKPVPHIEVVINKGFTFAGSVIETLTTNADGFAQLPGVDYGVYKAVVEDENFDVSSLDFIVQNQKTKVTIPINPSENDFDMTVTMKVENRDVDMDLSLLARNPEGFECEVSPLNKYCAYSMHSKDVTAGAQGIEIINIKDLAVAEYKTMVGPAPAYQASCAAFESVQGVNFATSGGHVAPVKHAGFKVKANTHFTVQKSWDWNTIKQNLSLQDLGIQIVNVMGGKARRRNEGKKEEMINLIARNLPIESDSEAEQPKKLLNNAGKKPEGTVKESTKIAGSGKSQFTTNNNASNNQQAPASSDNNEDETPLPPNNSSTGDDHTAENLAQAQTDDQEAPQPTTSNTGNRRLLEEEAPDMVLIDCFTGFGEISRRRLDTYITAAHLQQSWEYCREVIPDGLDLADLQSANQAARGR
jgi:hypothetical protein